MGSARRITADAFRSLTARLRKETHIPEVVPVIDGVPHPAATAPPQPAEFVPLPEPDAPAVPEMIGAPDVDLPPQPATAEAAAPEETGIPAFPDFGAWPSFAPLQPQHEWPVEDSAADVAAPALQPEPVLEAAAATEPAAEPEPVVAEPAAEPEPVVAEPAAEPEPVFDETAAAQPEAEPQAIKAQPAAAEPAVPHAAAEEPDVTVAPDLVAVVPEMPDAPAPEPEPEPEPETVAAAKTARAASPLADKVVEALVKTVSEAVYARPSAAERAAFLREVAELVERDGDRFPSPLDQPPVEEAAPAPANPLEGLRKSVRKTGEADPFAAGVQARLNPPRPAELPEADEDTGELALSLLEMMSGGSASSQPQERALAADTLLRLVPKIPVRQLLTIAERVAIMEVPPSLLVARLIRDPRPEIAAPLLERCAQISDADLMLAATEGNVHKQRMLARRRVLSPALSDQLIARGDTSVILTLVRNPGAALSHETFYVLAEHALANEGLLAPLTTRADLPAPVAFELLWHVPQELRRFIFSRFLTDSENLNRILKITLSTKGEGAETKFPERDAIDACIAEVVAGKLDTAAAQLGELAGIATDTALRILSDRDGEPLAVAMKAVGYPRGSFGEALEALQKGDVQTLRRDRKLDELQGIFDTLSFNKARILLTYWDWFITKSGPYAPHH